VVEGDNIHGCINYDSVRINVQQPVQAFAEPDTQVCAGEDVRLVSGGGLYYRWDPPTFLSTPNVRSPMATPLSPINYVVNVSNDCFSDTATVSIDVLPLPNVDAGNDTTVFRELSAQLEASGALDYVWTPFDGLNDPFIFDPLASPLSTTTYVVTGTDAFGCQNTDSVTVFIDPFTVLLVPTGFSPNGDGINDLFGIVKHLNLENLIEFRLFNRWGEEIWVGTEFTDRWDGTFNGMEQPITTYGWFIKALDFDNNTVIRKGNVTLIR
jgi:gliding motility-associated-like protein